LLSHCLSFLQLLLHRELRPTQRNGISNARWQRKQPVWARKPPQGILPCWHVGPVHPAAQRHRPLTWWQVALFRQPHVWLQFWPYLFSWHASWEQKQAELLGSRYERRQPSSSWPSRRHLSGSGTSAGAWLRWQRESVLMVLGEVTAAFYRW